MIKPAESDQGDVLREVSVSPDGRFWIDVVARPDVERPWKWRCKVSVHRRRPDGSPNLREHLDKPVSPPHSLNGFSTPESAVEYGRSVGLQMAAHAVREDGSNVAEDRQLPGGDQLNGFPG